MFKKVKQFWTESFITNPSAFCFEMVGFIGAVAASFYLALTAKDPDMSLVYPIFFLAALASTIAHYKRKLAFPMLLTIYFCIVNVFGFGRAIDIW